MNNIFNQAPFECRMDWDVRGVKEAVNRGDIIVIVDVIRFSSIVVDILNSGIMIYPYPRTGDIEKFAKLVDGEICIIEQSRARDSNLPALADIPVGEFKKGKRFVLSSLNGATCTSAASDAEYVFSGCFLNARAVAKTINKLKEDTNKNITVIACGERWSSRSGILDELRPSIEDYLGAGAILSLLNGTKSPEARVCIGAFKKSKDDLTELILDSSSGRELINIGLGDDIIYYSKLNLLNTVPFLRKDKKGYSYYKDYIIV